MANLLVKDGGNSDKYIQKSGAGTDLDPFVDPSDGQSSTTTSVDGDLRNIDTPAERLSTDPEANTSGNATVSYSRNFLLRWMVGLLQDLFARIPGNIAHDSADTASNHPVKTGARAVSQLEAVTAVSAGDVVDNVGDLDGAQIVRIQVPLGDLVSDRVADTAGTSTAFTNLNAGGSGVRNYLCTLHVYNNSTTNGHVDIRDGTAGSVIWTVGAPAQSGAVITFNPPLRQPTANTALAYDVSAAITTVYINAHGFQSRCG